MRVIPICVIATFLSITPVIVAGDQQSGDQSMSRKIVMKVDEQEIFITLNDSKATTEFVAMLPITLQFRDYNSTEKVSDLPRKLSTSGSPAGFDPSVGDLAYYAPWGNLAIFYRDFGYSNSLVLLGRLEAGIEILAAKKGEFSVHIKVVE